MRRIHLIRHAVYEGHSSNPARYVGRTDPELSAEGRKQAALLGQSAPELHGLPVWASTARRARETALLAFPDADMRLTRNAMEIDYGRIDGLSVVEAARLYPEFFSRRSRGGSALDFKEIGGEALGDLVARADRVTDEMQSFPEVVLVSHAIFLSVLCSHLVGACSKGSNSFGFCGRATLEHSIDGGWSHVD
jgi:broad specificity phosphatase PhoE